MYTHILARFWAVARDKGLSTAKRLLWRENAQKRPEKQCKGLTVTRRWKNAYVPDKTYCDNWQCWIHGKTKAWRVGIRIQLGMQFYISQGHRFKLFRLSTQHGDPDPEAWKAFWKALQRMARYNLYEVRYYWIQLPKQSGDHHGHAVVSWLPDPENLEKLAAKYGFDCHVSDPEVVDQKDVENVAGYMRYNLEKAVENGDVPMARGSRGWPVDHAVGRDPDVEDFLHITSGKRIRAHVKGFRPFRIYQKLAVDTWQNGGDVGVDSFTCLYRGEKGQKGQKGQGDPIRQKLLWKVEYWLSDLKRCSKCDRLLPVGKYQKTGKGKRRKECKDCTAQYESLRNSRPDRKAYLKAWRRIRKYGRAGGSTLL